MQGIVIPIVCGASLFDRSVGNPKPIQIKQWAIMLQRMQWKIIK